MGYSLFCLVITIFSHKIIFFKNVFFNEKRQEIYKQEVNKSHESFEPFGVFQ